MSRYQIDSRLRDIDKTMRQLRQSMKGLQVRRGGFKRDHDELARSLAAVSVLLESAGPLIGGEQHRRKTSK